MVWPSVHLGYCKPSMNSVLFVYFFFTVQRGMVTGISSSYNAFGSEIEGDVKGLFNGQQPQPQSVDPTYVQMTPQQKQDLSLLEKDLMQKLY